MQWESAIPARRVIHVILALVYLGLSGCGGGGGASSASAPPGSPNDGSPGIAGSLGNVLDEGEAAALIAEIDGEGDARIFMIEADSATFSLNGQSPETNTLLSKMPSPVLSSMDLIPTEYSRFAYFTSALDEFQEPGRYLLWGRLAATTVKPEASYQLHGRWTCAGCTSDGRVLQGDASGSLDADFSALTGNFSLNGDRLTLNGDISIGKNLEFHEGSRFVAHFDGKEQVLSQHGIRGGFFGPEAIETGLLYGFGSDGRVFSGAAAGIMTPE